jgi:hypothetical protein
VNKNNVTFWHDFKYGDTYEIYFTETDEFEVAYRHRGQVGAEPALAYHSIDSIPAHHRREIDQIVWKRHTKHHK